MNKRCWKGKSCGATCITQADRCIIDLGPEISESLSKVRSKLGVVKLYYAVRDQKIKGGQAKFEGIRKNLAQEIGGRINRTADLIELKNRLQKEGLIPKSKKSEDDLGAIFMRGLQAGNKGDRAPSVPADLKAQLGALGGAAPMAPRQLSKSPGGARMRPPAEPTTKKGETSLILDDISRLMRGESPRNIQIASAGDELGLKGRMKPTEVRKIERQLQSALGSRANSAMNMDQLREAAAKQANELSLQREKATAAADRKALRERIDKLDAAVKRADELNATATGNTRWARVDAKDHDDSLVNVRREGDAKYQGWKDSYGSGATKIGEGSYGTVIKNPDGTFVKRGDIADTEASLIKRLGEKDLGPKLVAADINGPARYHTEKSVDMKTGRIAMGQVPGSPIGGVAAPNTPIGGKNAADIYWKAMADLHRMGIAHNDAHIDNILVDKNGKGRWVDLGLAQASPKAALAEAMGIFKPLKGGDDITLPSGATGEGNWQTTRWNATGVSQAERLKREGKWAEFQQRFPVASRVWDNQGKVIKKMEDMGMDVNEINSVISHGIRSTPESYTKSDGFKRITDSQAQDLINTLYDGI